ncbi:unnamed protein product, partial [Lymnaea stagnalis]
AVLIHRGPTAYSGHYIAHIREQGEAGAWYKYNDEEIEKMKNKKLELGKEEDALATTESNSEKAPKVSKGNHSSRNAYMLVYSRCKKSDNGENSAPATVSEDVLPAAVKGYVQHDNQEFEDWITEMLEAQEKNINNVKERYEEMRNIYTALRVKSLDEPWEWVTLEWLTKWLADPTKMKQATNKIPKCPHDRLPPDDVVKMKCITSVGAEMLFSKNPIENRHTGESLLCDNCIRQKCREIRFRLCMSDDDKLFGSTKNISTLDPDEEYFWVSTKHLRSWKKYAMDEIAIKPAAAQGTQAGCSKQCTSFDITPSSFLSSDQEASSSSVSSNSGTGCNVNNSSHQECQSFALCEQTPLLHPSGQELCQVNSSFLPRHTGLRKQEVGDSSRDTAPLTRLNSFRGISDGIDGEVLSSCLHRPEGDGAQISKRRSVKRSSAKKRAPPKSNGTESASCDQIFMDACESSDSGTIILRQTDQGHLGDNVTGTDDCIENQKLEEAKDLEGWSRCNGHMEDRDGSGEEGRQEEAQDDEEKFNDDILCEHGNLRVDEIGRRAVSKMVWERLQYYFPHMK